MATKTWGVGLFVVLAVGCTDHHRAPVGPSEVFPERAPVQHASRLWIDFDGMTEPTQCISSPEHRAVCFESVDDGIESALRRVLYPSFTNVAERGRDDGLEPGDYLLRVGLSLDVVPPGQQQVGWAAGVRGRWQLVRDGFPVAGEGFASRSRGGFAYGSQLAVGAREVLDAVALRIADVVVAVPEHAPEPDRRRPEVLTSGFYGPIEERPGGFEPLRVGSRD